MRNFSLEGICLLPAATCYLKVYININASYFKLLAGARFRNYLNNLQISARVNVVVHNYAPRYNKSVHSLGKLIVA